MAPDYRPRWLRLAEAIDFLKSRGVKSEDAQTTLRRMIQDQLYPTSLGGLFRLPNWQYDGRLAKDRSWVTAPKIDWKSSTIIAPHRVAMGRVDRSTLIEVSAADLGREFPHTKDLRPGNENAPPSAITLPRPPRSRSSKFQQAKVVPVLRSLFGAEVPGPDKLTNGELCKAVLQELPKGSQVSKDSILRAACRRK